MFTVTTVFHRPSADVKWFAQSSEGNRLLNDQYAKAEQGRPGWVGRWTQVDGDTVTLRIDWLHSAAYRNWRNHSRQLYREFLKARKDYYHANGITMDVTTSEPI